MTTKIEPGSPEWYERVDALLWEEAGKPTSWWWLSFTDPTRSEGSQFLGVAIVPAGGMASAVTEAGLRGINPGGQVMGIEIPDEHLPPPEYRNRLLTRQEAESLP